MVQEAEANSAADKQRKELVEARNQADAAVHSTEKALAEHGDKIGDADRAEIQTALDALKGAKDGEDAADISAKTNALVQASMKLGEAMYKSQQEAGGDDASSDQPADDNVVDAEFEDVTDDQDADKKEQA